MRTVKKVMLSIDTHEYAFGREKVKGIIDYYQRNSSWEIYHNPLLRPVDFSDNLKNWDGDGMIGEIYSAEDAEIYRSLPMPVVNIASSWPEEKIPSVEVDNHAIGRMAAEHLIERKLDHFAFIGAVGELSYVRKRYEGFAEVLAESGGSCVQIPYLPTLTGWHHFPGESDTSDQFLNRLRELELPVGVMVATDRDGFAVLEACRKLELSCPDDVALVSVDNDEIFCNLAYSSMTSIDPHARRIGFEAASMLDRLMNGLSPENSHILIPPDRIVSRKSTDLIHSEYLEVAAALRFIRNHAHEPIDVTSVLDVVPISRRALETKFKAETGHGIYQEIRRVHTERAKQFLANTDWSAARIAWESGFGSPERMENAFRQVVGMSTSEYRSRQAE